MKKLAFLFIVCSIVVWAITYVAFAFVNNSWDSFVWGYNSRAGYALICALEFFLVCWAIYDEDKK